MRTIQMRNRAIVEMALTGMTYEAIGAEFGVTRERVRQILKKFDIDGATTRAVRAASRAEALVADGKRIREWARHNPGLGSRDAEQSLGLPEGRVAEALGGEVSRIFVRQRPATRLRYSDEEIATALRQAEILQGTPLSKVAYDEYVTVFGGPSGVLVAKRFGTWKNACREAGLAVNTLPGNCNRRWGKGQLVELLLTYFAVPALRLAWGGA